MGLQEELRAAIALKPDRLDIRLTPRCSTDIEIFKYMTEWQSNCLEHSHFGDSVTDTLRGRVTALHGCETK